MRIDILEILINISLASFGGFVKRLSEMEKQPNQKATFGYYMVGAFISMFVGIVVYFLCKNFDVSPFLTAGLTALSGYIGVPVLDLLSDMAKKRMEKRS
jgi:hypothetical protein